MRRTLRFRGIFKASVAAASVALVAAAPAGAQEQGDKNRAEQAGQTPPEYCKQFAVPRTADFRECVVLAARALRKGENGDQSGGNPNIRATGAPGRFCQSNGSQPKSEAFRDCVRVAAKARRAARG